MLAALVLAAVFGGELGAVQTQAVEVRAGASDNHGAYVYVVAETERDGWPYWATSCFRGWLFTSDSAPYALDFDPGQQGCVED